MSTPQSFQMPKVYQGQMVIWYLAPGGQGSPAVVTKIGTRSLCLSVMSAGFQNMLTPEGVLHVSDPNVSRMLENESGVWDYNERDKVAISQARAVPAPEPEKRATAKAS